jgi:hypothetical protein
VAALTLHQILLNLINSFVGYQQASDETMMKFLTLSKRCLLNRTGNAGTIINPMVQPSNCLV